MKLHKPQKPGTKWNSPINDYAILTLESCKLIFEQSKAYFDETIQESEELTQRSARMLFLLLPAVAAVVAFCFANQTKLRSLNNFRLMLILVSVGSFVNCIYNLFKLISPKNMHYRGSQPKEVMRKEIFKLGNSNEVEKALYVSEIERYQIKIEQMEFWNYERIRLYTAVVYSFNAMMIIGIFLLILSI